VREGQPALLARAEQAVTAVARHPQQAEEMARAVLLAADGDGEVAAVALRAMGLAAKEQGRLSAAIRSLRRAVRLAERGGHRRRAAEARMSLVVLLADAGRTTDALALAEQAAAGLDGGDRGRLLAQRGLVHARAGEAEAALECFRRALPALRRAGDALWEARVLLNRGILHVYRAAYREAETDLSRCRVRASQAGLDAMAAKATHNLGFTALRRGDVPRSLALIDEAHEQTTALGIDELSTVVDRAEALLVAGLADEAYTVLSEAVTRHAGSGFAYDLAEVRLAKARAALPAGEPAVAAQEAARARRAFSSQGRPGWAALARHVEVRGRWAVGERGASLLRAALASADELNAVGWPVAAQHSRIIAARLALHAGRADLADDLLQQASSARRRGPAELRSAAWHAQALRHLDRRERAAALAALRRGLAVVADYAQTLGATDLRASAASYGGELAGTGVGVALETGRARTVLDWAERWRASTLRQPALRPPADPRLAADLAALRAVSADLQAAALEGRDTTVLQAEQVRLEQAVRRRARHAPGSAPRSRAASPAPTGSSVLLETLGERALVEYLRHEQRLWAVAVAGRRLHLVDLGDEEQPLRELEALRFALHVLARQQGSPAVLATAAAGLRHSAARLDAHLLEPVSRMVGDRELVVVPTGVWHALPWTALPSLAGRPVSVAPSAAGWVDAAGPAAGRSGRDRRAPVLVAGPRLRHAQPEVEMLARRYPDARVLTGAAASAERVRQALDGAGLAHVAAHGRFRADNPLFSSIELADGPLTVYDLERLRRAPEVLVLSACESGLSAVAAGDELMGLAAAVLGLGTRALVGSVTPVSDADTRRLMDGLHQRLDAGLSPAHALAAARAATGVEGFVCLGAG